MLKTQSEWWNATTWIKAIPRISRLVSLYVFMYFQGLLQLNTWLFIVSFTDVLCEC